MPISIGILGYSYKTILLNLNGPQNKSTDPQINSIASQQRSCHIAAAVSVIDCFIPHSTDRAALILLTTNQHYRFADKSRLTSVAGFPPLETHSISTG